VFLHRRGTPTKQPITFIQETTPVTTPIAQTFFEACGAIGPLPVVVQLANGTEERRDLVEPFALVGRDPDADLLLNEEDVSRRHAYLQMIAGRLFCLDLFSRNGVRFGDTVARCGWVGEGGIWLGLHQLRTADAVAPPSLAPEWNPLADEWPGPGLLWSVTLEFLTGLPRLPPWEPHRCLSLIGTSSVCKVRLRSKRVSRIDAALVRTPGGVWAVNLLGRGRLRVNGARVRSARLMAGDLIEVAEFQIRVLSAAPAVSPRAEDSRGLKVTRVLPGRSGLDDSRTVAVPGGELGSSLEAGLAALGAPATAPLILGLFRQFDAFQQQMFDQFQQALLAMAQMFGTLHQGQLDHLRKELESLHGLTQELQSLKTQFGAPKPNPAEQPRVASRLTPQPSAEPALGENGEAGRDKRPAVANPPPGDIHTWLCGRMATLEQERQTRWEKILSFFTGHRATAAPPHSRSG
jgi:pSer/pThr/pTyr-binding forkhead associated (FHA) protein